MSKLEQEWARFVEDLAVASPEAYVQIRKVFRDVTWEVPFSHFDGLTLGTEHMGYSAGESKMNQLRRNYLNVPELERARDSLKSRASKQQSCITARFGSGAKDSRSQGFCMQTITLNHISKPEPGKPQFVVELYYGSTEVGQKFFADLMFLDQIVFPILLRGLPRPDIIRFKFSTLYLSSMFLPVVFQVTDVRELMENIREKDPKWFTRCVRIAVEKWMVEECFYNYRTRAKMHDLFREYVYPKLSKSDIKAINEMVRK